MDDKCVQQMLRVTMGAATTRHRRDEGRGQYGRSGRWRRRKQQPVGRVETDIVESAPKSMKQKAQPLVEKLKADTAIAWKIRGKFLYDDVSMIGSNMMDLVPRILL